MRKPANMMECPQGGWHCRFPDGFEASSNHPSDFLRQCYGHLVANDLDTSGGWQDRMWDLFCETHPEVPHIDIEAPPVRAVTGDDVWRFFNSLKEAVIQGAEAVSDEEQDRRIGICLACPKLTHVSCSFGCGKIAEIIGDLTLGRKSRRLVEAHKANCGVCACEISTVTAWPLDVLKRVDEKVKFKSSDYPSNCWKLQ